MGDKEEFLKVAKREKYFSTLAKTEEKGAIQREHREHGPAKKDSKWEVEVDKEFAKKRSRKAKVAKEKAIKK